MNFKPTMGLLALLSIALNIGLIALSVFNSESAAIKSPTPMVERSEGAHLDSYENLLAKGLSDFQAKTVVLASLRADTTSEAIARPDYWKPATGNVKIERIQSMLNRERQLRLSLLDIFGEPAKTDPAFSPVFQPLANRLDFLSSDQQIAIREQRINGQIKALRHAKSGIPSAVVAATDVLPAQAAFEYELRYSTAAGQLRRADIDFTEQLFRDTFRILVTAPNGSSKSQQGTLAIIQQRADLKLLLGRDNATKVMAALDSRFANMSKKGRFQGLTQDQLYFVYQIIIDSEAQMIRGFHLRQTNQNTGIAMIRQASATRKSKLSSYLGEDVAAELMRAFADNDVAERSQTDVAQSY